VDAVKLPAFIRLMDVFFESVKANKIKVRIMFKQNAKVAINLRQDHIENEYFLLYYQFIKHAFGLKYSVNSNPINVRLHFDYLPDTKTKIQQFREYIKGIGSIKAFEDAKIKIKKEDIVEVNSKDHLPLQFLDVVLGAIQFKLNNKHKFKEIGAKRRGKRTIAKEKLYKHISKKINKIRPYFNVGISTGSEQIEDKWKHTYRHWCFIPKEFEVDETLYK
jgi:Protein of unknown function (DUF3800)